MFEANWSEPQLIASWTKPVPKVFAVTVDDADLAYIWPLNQSGIEVYSRSGSHVGKIPTFDAAMDHNLSADPRYGLLLADSSMHSLTAVDRKGFEREVMPEGRVDPTEPSKMLSYPFAVQEDADKLVWVSNDWGMDKRPDMAVIDLGARRFARVAWGDHLKELEIENTDDLATFLISPTKHVLFACLNGRATMGEYEYRVKWK